MKIPYFIGEDLDNLEKVYKLCQLNNNSIKMYVKCMYNFIRILKLDISTSS